MNQTLQTQEVKKVVTFDLQGKENGFLIELFKDSKKTTAYLTCAKPGAFKGYHLHRVRAARYVCIKGTMKISVYINGVREEYIMSPDKPYRLFIPHNVPTGLENIGTEDAWLINYPDPAYDPSLQDEQIDFTREECESGEYLKKI